MAPWPRRGVLAGADAASLSHLPLPEICRLTALFEPLRPMPRYKLTIEYDGTPYSGWQIQDSDPSVQGRLREAIRAFSGEDITPRGAGRTDSGVHATGQVAHIDLTRDWPADTVGKAVNFYLRPDPVAVLACEQVSEEFDARFSAR